MNELRVKVAELRGWKNLGTFEADTLTHRIPLGVPPEHAHGGSKYRLPNYPNDLNACADLIDLAKTKGWWCEMVNLQNTWRCSFRRYEAGIGYEHEAKSTNLATAISRAFVAVMEASRP